MEECTSHQFPKNLFHTLSSGIGHSRVDVLVRVLLFSIRDRTPVIGVGGVTICRAWMERWSYICCWCKVVVCMDQKRWVCQRRRKGLAVLHRLFQAGLKSSIGNS